jgi:DNA-binding CsgD family transcriptional regulator
MLSDVDYFSYLYEIASSLNKEFSLHSALKKALEKTVELLDLETGWIWLMQNDKSVYLAASYNLPPALKDHPERLSGRCYCIEKYLSNNIDKAKNISEISCTRLHNLKSGTLDLKFHATIPINNGNQKVGLINLLSKETQQLNKAQLCLLNTISELIGIVIQRTRAQEANPGMPNHTDSSTQQILKRVFPAKLELMIKNLETAKVLVKDKAPEAMSILNISLEQTEQLREQLFHVLDEVSNHADAATNKQFHYPSSPLTSRELELLVLVKKGFTNKQIAEALFVSERTVKFHITSILSKLFARTRTEAVDIALKRGLIGLM